MPRRARYVADNGTGSGFGGFMLSSQIRQPVKQITRVMAAEASATDGTEIAGSYDTEDGPAVMVAGNLRISERVTNNHPKAAAFEFGSGEANEGATGPNERPQGGYSPARRHLGYIAAGYHDVLGEPG